MATYYSSSSNERDVMPTIYPRNSLGSYPEDEVLPTNMMMYLNQTPATTSYGDSVPGDYQLQLNHGELSSTRDSHSIPSSQGNLSDLIGSHVREPSYDLWRDGRNEMSFMQPMSGSATMESIGKQIDDESNPAHSSVGADHHTGLSPRMENLGRGKNLRGQGLSLSLSSQIPTAVPVSLFNYHSANLGFSSFFNSYPSTSGGGTNETGRDDEIGRSLQSGNVYFPHGFPRENHNVIKGETDLRYVHSNRLSGLSSIIPKSKYLKVTQQLLDEVVDVRKDLKQETDKNQSFRFGSRGSKDGEGTEECGLLPKTKTLRSSEESNTNPAGELSPANIQNLQEKNTELTSMLDEVDRRYKQYYHQMQIVASYFDAIAGGGASKPYTTLALRTISCHFRRIRDAISGQIKTVQSSLGEDDNLGKTKEGGISRLRFVEQKLRQHRALQQLGMMQQHAWRPQRGLPETSVTILRAWLFEHFLHPYPKDSDKIMLARQTGLTRGQVSNWFINARVRLWKPMIEDMYKEEIGDSEIDSNSSSDNTPNIASSSIKVSEDFGKESPKNICLATTEKVHIDQFIESNSEFTHNMEGHTSINCFRDEGHGEELGANYVGTKLMGDQRSDMLNYRPFQSHGNADGRYIVASAAYQMAEVEMFGSQGGISLTLGLQHFEGTIPDPNHHNFVTVQGDDLYNVDAPSAKPNNADGDCMDPDNQQYRFDTSHLLHDFVA